MSELERKRSLRLEAQLWKRFSIKMETALSSKELYLKKKKEPNTEAKVGSTDKPPTNQDV